MSSESHLLSIPFDEVGTWHVGPSPSEDPAFCPLCASGSHVNWQGKHVTEPNPCWFNIRGSLGQILLRLQAFSPQETCAQTQITPFCPGVDSSIGWLSLSALRTRALTKGLLFLWIICGQWPDIIASLIPDLWGQSAECQLRDPWGFSGSHLTLAAYGCRTSWKERYERVSEMKGLEVFISPQQKDERNVPHSWFIA